MNDGSGQPTANSPNILSSLSRVLNCSLLFLQTSHQLYLSVMNSISTQSTQSRRKAEGLVVCWNSLGYVLQHSINCFKFKNLINTCLRTKEYPQYLHTQLSYLMCICLIRINIILLIVVYSFLNGSRNDNSKILLLNTDYLLIISM